jgi:hypothetical protein
MRFDRKDSARVVHRLDAVQDEVHRHPLDLHPVRDAGKLKSRIRTDGNSMSRRFSTQQRDQDRLARAR